MTAIKRTFLFLQNQYQNIIPYAVFGVLTTLVNIVVYWFAAHLLALSVMCSTVLAWGIAVLFAYITNRKWVFHSQAKTSNEILREILSFFTCRIATGIVDLGCMFIFANLLRLDDIITKVGVNFLVIVLNYIASKFFIF